MSQDGRKLSVAWKDGHKSNFHVAWLRHNCCCSKCVSSSGQKLVGAEELFEGMVITEATVSGKLKYLQLYKLMQYTVYTLV